MKRTKKLTITITDKGCDHCDATESKGGFRTDPDTGSWLCNICRCKMYRKRRREGEAGAAAAEAEAAAAEVEAATAAEESAPSPGRSSGEGTATGSLEDCLPALKPQPCGAFARLQYILQSPATPAGQTPVLPPPPVAQPEQQEQPHAAAERQRHLQPPPPCHAGQWQELQHSSRLYQQEQQGLQRREASNHGGAPPEQQAAAQAQQHADPPDAHPLTVLQRRVLGEQGDDDACTARLLHSAWRAQQATPACAQRRALAVLPQLVLHFPDDPPGMQHPVSCLLEAVRTQQSSPSPAAAAPQTPAAAAAAPPWSVRVTVFSAAGAVACWHEGEMGCSAVMLASPATGAPMWWTGPSLRSFSLEFPLASGLQLELFKAACEVAVGSPDSAAAAPVVALIPAVPPRLHRR